MRLGLGNNLVKTAFPIGTSPSLDLAFALDRSFTTDPADAGKALITSRRGPAAKFSRGSGATQVNAAGLIEYAPENLAFPSDMSSPWSASRLTATPATGSPLGTYQILTVIDSTGVARLSRTVVVPSSQPYTISVFAKAGTVSTFAFRALTDASSSVLFNLLGGTTSGSGASGWSGQAQMTPYPDGWYRCSMTYTPTALSQNYCVDLGLAVLGGTIDFTGFQLERASTARTYYPTTTAAFYGPRFDYDPATGASKGLLIEEPRTNLVYKSQLITSPEWLLGAVTVADNGTGPSGATVQEITETPTIAVHSVGNQGGSGGVNATPVVSGTTYTGSIFLKKSTVDWVQLTFGSAGFGSAQYANFNISNGTIGNSAGLASGTVPRIEQFPNGWWRCSISAVATSTTNTLNVGAVFTDNSGTAGRVPSYLGSTGNSFLATMAQFEAGAFPLSYIPTTSGTAARGADVCSIIGTDFNLFYNQSEGTLFAECQAPSANQYAGIAVIGATSFNHNIALFKSDSTGGTLGDRFVPYVTQAGTLVALYDFGTGTGNGLMKVAASAALNNMIFARNGTISPADLTAAMPTPNRLTIGARADGNYINGHIARIQYFRKRLSNAKLQTITAP